MYRDNEHIIQLKKGSYKAFDTLYRRYFALLYGFVFRMTRSHERTCDLVQDAFTKVWLHRSTIDHQMPFKAWLFKIARNCLIDTMKAQWSTPLFEDWLEYSSDVNLAVNCEEGSFDFEAFLLLLAAAKKKLSPRQSEVFYLICECDHSADEVAKELNISLQAVYNYLTQAKAILQKEMLPHKNLIFWILLKIRKKITED